MQFKVILTRTIEQAAETEIEAEDFEAAKSIVHEQFKRGQFEFDDTVVEYGVHEIRGGGKYQEFSFDGSSGAVREDKPLKVNGNKFLEAVKAHEAAMGPEKLAAAYAAANYSKK